MKIVDKLLSIFNDTKKRLSSMVGRFDRRTRQFANDWFQGCPLWVYCKRSKKSECVKLKTILNLALKYK